MAIANQIIKALAGFEDLLFGQGIVNQTRIGLATAITKINASVIPYSGDVATGDFVSISDTIAALIAQSAPKGNLAIVITGGVTTLTPVQFDNASFDITGVLTSNATVVIPDALPQVFIIDNQTSGSFTVTIKHATTPGLIVSQATRILMYTTGTVVEDVAQSTVFTAADIDNVPSGLIVETDVQGALDGLEARKLDASAAVANFTGAVIISASSIIPTGYLECDGAAIDRVTYVSLFTAIGTTYGIGDGATTFNLPDLRGEFVRGFDNARGIDVGRVFGTAQLDEFRAHTHTQDGTNYTTGGWDSGPGQQTLSTQTGAAGGVETRPRNVAMLYVIKF